MTDSRPPMPAVPPQPATTPASVTARKPRTRLLIGTAITVAAASAITGLVVWLSQPSYNEIVKNCVAALKDRPEGDKSKPAACDDVKDDDYNAIYLSTVLDDLGWTDDDGNFDKNKMLEDTLNDMP